MATLELEFDVYCSECGARLSAEGYAGSKVEVEPCGKCLQAERNEGFQEGVDSVEEK